MENSIRIVLNNISKKFGREWIFKNISIEIKPAEKWVVLGGNGSGKSTFLQLLSGYITPDAGQLSFLNENITLSSDAIPYYVSFASPYLQFNEELTLGELVSHLTLFRKYHASMDKQQIAQILELDKHTNLPLKNFSSGMKQRVKLGLAILDTAPVLLLDEPASNLDANSIKWYQQMIKLYAKEKTIVVCSNEIADEFSFCNHFLKITEYKPIIKQKDYL